MPPQLPMSIMTTTTTPWNTVLPENLTVAHILNSWLFMKPEGLLMYTWCNYMASHKRDKWNSMQVTPISRLIFENNTFLTSFWAVWKMLVGKSVAFSKKQLSSESSVYLTIKTTQFSQCTNKGFLLQAQF